MGAAAWVVEVAGIHRSGEALGCLSSGIWGGISVGPAVGQWLGSFERAALLQEMADELERFLEGRPIVARPIGNELNVFGMRSTVGTRSTLRSNEAIVSTPLASALATR